MALDEGLAGGHFLAHELREDRVGAHGVLNVHAEDGADVRIHRGLPELVRVHLAETLIALDGDAFAAILELTQVGVPLLVAVEPTDFATVLDAVERWLGDVEVAALDKVAHVAEEERQKKRADVRAVYVCVGHDYHAMVAQLGEVEVFAEASAERGDNRLDLLVGKHLVRPRLLDVQDLAAQRQDRLEAAVAAFLGTAARGRALDEV